MLLPRQRHRGSNGSPGTTRPCSLSSSRPQSSSRSSARGPRRRCSIWSRHAVTCWRRTGGEDPHVQLGRGGLPQHPHQSALGVSGGAATRLRLGVSSAAGDGAVVDPLAVSRRQPTALAVVVPERSCLVASGLEAESGDANIQGIHRDPVAQLRAVASINLRLATRPVSFHPTVGLLVGKVGSSLDRVDLDP